MSRKLVFASLVISGLVIGAGAGVTWEYVASKKNEGNRMIASVPAMPMDKSQASLSVRIVPPEYIPESDEDVVEVRAYISKRSENMDNVSFQWKLSDGVLSGDHLSGQINDLAPGETLELKILVKGFSKEEKRVVSLEVWGYRDDLKLGNSSLISSRPEDSMEYIAPLMADLAQEGDFSRKIIK